MFGQLHHNTSILQRDVVACSRSAFVLGPRELFWSLLELSTSGTDELSVPFAQASDDQRRLLFMLSEAVRFDH